jgi:phospholipase/carboxylesterase
VKYIHQFIPAAEHKEAAPTLLLLHGTGGNEFDMLPLGNMFARAFGDNVNILSPKGNVSEFGAARFFRRLAEGVFDVEDLKTRTGELNDFLHQAASEYGFDAERIIAIGYSNGANIAGSMMLMFPEVLAGIVQLRPMIPFQPDTLPHIPATPVFIASGNNDPTVRLQEARSWAAMLQQAGALVTFQASEAGHQLTQADIESAITWCKEHIVPQFINAYVPNEVESA